MHFIRLLTGLVILFPLALTSPLSPRDGGTSLGPEDTNDVVNTDDVLSPGGAANILGGLDVSGLPPAGADGVPNRPGRDGGRGAGRNEGGFYGSSYYPQASEARPAVTPEVAPNTQGWESNSPASNVWDGATPAASPARSPHASPTAAGVWTGSYAKPTGSTKPLVARRGSSPSHSSSSWTLPSNSYTDVQLLNLALDLQHLLQAFYAHLALDYDIRAFVNIGYPSWVRNRFLQIQVFPDAHIGALVDVIIQIGGKPVRGGCAYYFDDRAVIELIAMAELLETAAVSIYGNILPLLDSRVSVKILGDIMATHARRAAWINAVVRGSSAWNTAFEVKLDLLSPILDVILTSPIVRFNRLPCPSTSL
ncbi:hypothetical protein FA13DRAFT_1523002 [Coprinellus micaceus]|uniref:Uncharacterized protein n=1 Tax=Coprinellus micaceus TaxID=71717 RepID=A0A4Y7SJY7_COPMI|nr:hypothetical protein FA13DRAFT_1523002 [Coprinellus micaceus]